MAVLRVRDIVYLARDGVTVNVAGWEYPLSALYADTTPEEWIPRLGSLGAWTAGNYEIGRDAAQRVADTYNSSKPWESSG